MKVQSRLVIWPEGGARLKTELFQLVSLTIRSLKLNSVNLVVALPEDSSQIHVDSSRNQQRGQVTTLLLPEEFVRMDLQGTWLWRKSFIRNQQDRVRPCSSAQFAMCQSLWMPGCDRWFVSDSQRRKWSFLQLDNRPNSWRAAAEHRLVQICASASDLNLGESPSRRKWVTLSSGSNSASFYYCQCD